MAQGVRVHLKDQQACYGLTAFAESALRTESFIIESLRTESAFNESIEVMVGAIVGATTVVSAPDFVFSPHAATASRAAATRNFRIASPFG
jgi:hypothetical protein